MSYNKPTISNYNDNAPADDGSAVTANKVKWSKVKDEIGDPLKNYADAINNAVETAFLQLFLADHETKTTSFTPSATDDDGTLFVCTNALTMTLPAAADAGEGYTVSTLNISGGTVTGDGASSETINGAATYSSLADYELTIYMCTGTAWYASTIPSLNALRAKKIKFPDDGELTIATGAVTVTGTYHTVDTEADAATDDLDTINGGADGQILYLRTENDARDVTITTAGNIETGRGKVILENTSRQVQLIYDGAKSKWMLQNNQKRLVNVQLIGASATYTPTPGAVLADVEGFGSGGGGGGGGGGTNGGNGGAGGDVVFAGYSLTLTASGGGLGLGGGSGPTGANGADGTGTNGDTNITGGGMKGGFGGTPTGDNEMGSCGGCGGYFFKSGIDISGGATATVTIGAAGTAGTAGSSAAAGMAGAKGYIKVYEYQ